MLEEVASVWGFLRLSMCVVVHTYNSHTWEAGQVDLCIPDLQIKLEGGRMTLYTQEVTWGQNLSLNKKSSCLLYTLYIHPGQFYIIFLVHLHFNCDHHIRCRISHCFPGYTKYIGVF